MTIEQATIDDEFIIRITGASLYAKTKIIDFLIKAKQILGFEFIVEKVK